MVLAFTMDTLSGRMRAMDTRIIESKVKAALANVRRVLDRARAEPMVAGEVAHDYEDKYCLAEGLISVAAASWLGSLERLGLDEARLRLLCEVARAGRHCLTLRCNVSEKCTFKKKTTRDIPHDTKVVHSGTFMKSETKLVTTVTEWFWDLELAFEIFVFAGAEPSLATDEAAAAAAASGLPAPAPIVARTATIELVTRAEQAPCANNSHPPLDVDVTWLFGLPTADGHVAFSVDRSTTACRTPRRNAQVEAASQFGRLLSGWCESVRSQVVERNKRFTAAHYRPVGAKEPAATPDYAKLTEALPQALMPLMSPEATEAAEPVALDAPKPDGAPADVTLISGEPIPPREAAGCTAAVVPAGNAFGTRPRSLAAADLNALVSEEAR